MSDKQGANLPIRHTGESDASYDRRVARWLYKDTARSKGDDREWTGSQPFHLNKEGGRQ